MDTVFLPKIHSAWESNIYYPIIGTESRKQVPKLNSKFATDLEH